MNSLNKDSVNESQHISLRRLLLISAGVVIGVGLIGPYQWHIYSLGGLVYYFLILVMIFLGLSSSGITFKKKESKPAVAFSFSKRQLSCLVLFSIISIISCCYLVYNFLKYYGSSYILLGGAYFDYSLEERGLIEKIATVFMQSGTAAYLIYACNLNKGSKAEKIILIFGFWTTALFYLLSGGRFSAAVSFVLFFVSLYINNAFNMDKISSINRKISLPVKIAVLILGILLLGVFLSLFESRQIYYTALQSCEFNSWDKTVREPYRLLYEVSNGAVSSFYFLCDYIAEAPYVFSYFFENYIPDSIVFFHEALRSVGKLLSVFGFSGDSNSLNALVLLSEKTGKYAGFAWPLLLDVGVYAAPFIAYFFGIVSGKIERAISYSSFCRVIYPCILVIVLFCPIYYLTVGRMDYILLWIFILWPLVKLFGSNKKPYPSNRDSRQQREK